MGDHNPSEEEPPLESLLLRQDPHLFELLNYLEHRRETFIVNKLNGNANGNGSGNEPNINPKPFDTRQHDLVELCLEEPEGCKAVIIIIIFFLYIKFISFHFFFPHYSFFLLLSIALFFHFRFIQQLILLLLLDVSAIEIISVLVTPKAYPNPYVLFFLFFSLSLFHPHFGIFQLILFHLLLMMI